MNTRKAGGDGLRKRSILVMMMVLCLGLLAGCKKSSVSMPKETESLEETAEETAESGSSQNFEFDSSKPALTVGYGGTIDNLNPFFADTYDSRVITGVTQVELLTTDRSGDVVYNAIEGETIIYKGTAYEYKGAADIQVDWNEEKNQTTYTITLRSDLKFSDGTAVDADDLIFTLYVLSDPSYDGPYTIYSLPIVGMKSYRSNAPADVAVTQDEIAQTLETMPENLKQTIVKNIIRVQLTQEMEWCKTIFENPEYVLLTEQFDSPEAMFASFYSRESDLDVTGQEQSQVLETVIAQYGADYKALGMAYANDETAFQERAEKLAENWLVEQKISQGLIGNAPNISGIQKINSRQVTITTEGYDATAIYQLNIPIAPLHYYGEEEKYNYENNQFGFSKEDLSHIHSLDGQPLGAGPYQFLSWQDGTVSMAANQYYYKGTPQTAQLQFFTVAEDQKIAAVSSGEADVVRIVGSLDNVEKIMKCNSNGSLTGDTLLTEMVDDLAYGYIGIQAEQVCVAGEPYSDTSRYLRRGLATLFSYYRQKAVEEYFGATASVIDYPMSQTLWASPQKSDSDYETAFSRDIHENPIYMEEMTEEEQLDAMKKAVLDYFRAAGYQIEQGVLTEAPEGASLTYEALLVQEEGTIHPCASLMEAAAELLKEMGMTLNVTFLNSEAELNAILQEGSQQIWCAECSAVIYPDLYEQYYSANCPGMGGTNENYFSLMDEELDALILEARKDDDWNTRKILYKQSMDLILDWAVEIPVYQGTDNVLFGAERVNINTVAEDITSYYSWVREIEKICLYTEEQS